ncbi:MAG: 30S ribosome-binding factor RbfA [Alphaproteobacteria bacterium]|jgi:ribosome-binding factor A
MKHVQNNVPSHAPSQRQLRVGEELRHTLVNVIRQGHFHDPDLFDAAITVTEVRISPDLKNATAYVTPLGGGEMVKTVAALNRAVGYFHREIARQIALRFVPRISFVPDTSFDYSSRIDALLNSPEVARDIVPEDSSRSESGESEDDSGEKNGA